MQRRWFPHRTGLGYSSGFNLRTPGIEPDGRPWRPFWGSHGHWLPDRCAGIRRHQLLFAWVPQMNGDRRPRVSIVGTVGLPAAYSGFETLAEHLVRYNERQGLPVDVTVYCSARHFTERPATYHGAALRYLDLDANNASSIAYDALAMAMALRQGADAILLLGVSGAIALPLVRMVSNVRIVTNIDGIEWRREKWRGIARTVLRHSERLAVRWSHEVVADNGAIVDHVRETYGRTSRMIAYGGDHALAVDAAPGPGLPAAYALALCRIEPENHVHTILEAFADQPRLPLVFIGNWERSAYGRQLKLRFGGHPGITILDPIYDVAILKTIRQNCTVYIHGHSAGGTNPSLVEMMHFAKPIIAYDCVFNRYSTDNSALFFSSPADLRQMVSAVAETGGGDCGRKMGELARARYIWDAIGAQYFQLLAGDRLPAR